MGKADRVERGDDAAPHEQQGRHQVPVLRKMRHHQCAEQPDGGADQQQVAAVADPVADHAKRYLQEHVTEADHGQQKCCIRLGIADTVAIDREQRETAGFHGAEHQDGRGGRGNKPDILQEATGLLAFGADGRAFLAGCQDRYRGNHHQYDDDAEGQETGTADSREQPGPGGETQRQHSGIDTQHQTAPLRRRRSADPEFGQDEQDRQRDMQHHAQRKPHPERGREMEADKGERAGGDHNQHGPGDAEARGDRCRQRCACDRGEAGHGGIEADHRRRMTA